MRESVDGPSTGNLQGALFDFHMSAYRSLPRKEPGRCARCIGPRFLRWLRGIFMATVMTAHVQDSRRAVLLIDGADGLKHLSSAAEAGTSAFKFGTTEQPHSTGVHDAIAGQKLDAKAHASRLLVSSIGGTQWTVVCAWLVLFLCDGRRSSSCHAGCCIGVLVCLPCPAADTGARAPVSNVLQSAF